MKRDLALLLLGLIIGGIICGMIAGSAMEKLYQEKEGLRVRLFETTDRLYRLEKQLHTREVGQIKEVIIELDTPSGTLVELALRQAAAEITADLVGENIELINPLLLIKLLHQRVISVEDKSYIISVTWVVVGETITYHLTASPAGSGSGAGIALGIEAHSEMGSAFVPAAAPAGTAATAGATREAGSVSKNPPRTQLP